MPRQHNDIKASGVSCAAFGCVLLLSLLPFARVQAFNAASVDIGVGLDDTRLLRLNLSFGEQWIYSGHDGWSWSRSWEASLSSWYLLNGRNEGNDHLVEVGLIPNFRLVYERPTTIGSPYLEFGIGLHLLSASSIGRRDLGSAYHFGSHGGFGVRFGDEAQYELAWRIEHLSNGGLKDTNPGIDFTMVRFGYRW